jgi:hypothetical protein
VIVHYHSKNAVEKETAITRYRGIVLLTMVAIAIMAGPHAAGASRPAIAPSSVAVDCPVIVTGEIVKIDRLAAKAPARFDRKTLRLLDVAHIRISQVNKNLLTGVSTKIGQTITARMHPEKGLRAAGMTTSLDLHYTIGTKALWMLYLREDGHFYINRRPEQRQPVGSYNKIKGRIDTALPIKKPKPGELPSQVHTVAEWIAKRRKIRVASEESIRQEKAFRAETKKAVVALYANGKLKPERLGTLIDQRAKVRSKLANMSASQMGISQDDWIVVRSYLARKDPVENHRVRALPGWIKGSQPARELLIESLGNESASMRLFACQAMMNADDQALTDKIAPLLADSERRVRMVAVRTLGRLGDKRHAKAIEAMYHKTKKITAGESATFGTALARLGSLDIPIACFPVAMASSNWNIRWEAMGIIQTCQSPRIVPVIMAELPGELARASAEYHKHHIQDRVLRAMTAELTSRTDGRHGLDIVAWMTWWSDQAPKYGAKPPTHAQIVKTKQIQTDYYRRLQPKKHGRSKKENQ